MDVLDVKEFKDYAKQKSYFVNLRTVRIESETRPQKLPVFDVIKLKAVIGDFDQDGNNEE